MKDSILLTQRHNIAFRAFGAVVLAILASLSTYARESTVGGITWTYRLRNGNVADENPTR